MGEIWPLFWLCFIYSHDKNRTNTKNNKSVDGVMGTRTQGGRMVGALSYAGTPLRLFNARLTVGSQQ